MCPASRARIIIDGCKLQSYRSPSASHSRAKQSVLPHSIGLSGPWRFALGFLALIHLQVVGRGALAAAGELPDNKPSRVAARLSRCGPVSGEEAGDWAARPSLAAAASQTEGCD